jgi:hypothetical protein
MPLRGLFIEQRSIKQHALTLVFGPPTTGDAGADRIPGYKPKPKRKKHDDKKEAVHYSRPQASC